MSGSKIQRKEQLQFVLLEGTSSYQDVYELQKRLIELRALCEVPDTVLILEHEPVITRGTGLQNVTGGQDRKMPLSPEISENLDYFEIERGGDLTCHNPGQLVIYPILDLSRDGFVTARNVTGLIRKLESLLIRVLEKKGILSATRDKATGVWVNGQKVASLGIAVRRWVSYHGIAINVVNDLGLFQSISPCGFSPDIMTRMQNLSPVIEEVQNSGWREWLTSEIISAWIEASDLDFIYDTKRLPGVRRFQAEGVPSPDSK